MARISDRQFMRLPRYAQDEIMYLRREVAHLESLLHQMTPGLSDSRITAEMRLESYPIPEEADIKFQLPEGDSAPIRNYIEADLRDDQVYIRSARAITIFPYGSNSVYIGTRDR